MRVTTVLVMAATTSGLGCNMARDQDGEVGSNILIGSEVSCPSCSIVFDSVVTLEGAYIGASVAGILRHSSGSFYLADGGDGLLKAYASDGRFLQEIGRHGGGPGEYEAIRNLMLAPDGSIRVLDGVLGRLSAFSPNGDFLGSTQVPVAAGMGRPAVLLTDGRLVVNYTTPATIADAGYALTTIDHEGNATRSFDEEVFDPQRRWLQWRLLWLRSTGQLLVARPFTFTIDVYDSDLTRIAAIQRVADWIPLRDPDEVPSDGTFDKPFTPQLFAIWEDERGLLWLYIALPSPLWKPGPPMQQIIRGEGLDPDTYRTLGARPRAETIIEVVDLEARQLLARMRVDVRVGAPFGRGYFALSAEDSVGEPSLRVSRVRLKH